VTPPLIIGAMGGSGTRVIARIVERAGVFIGTDRNVSEDAMPFVDFYDRWINQFVLTRALTPPAQRSMDGEFRACVARHRAAIGAAEVPWGWKEPRSIYLLPFFHRQFPDLRFIHVVRDGRDMAFSNNQNQLRKHGSAVLGLSDDAAPPHVRTALLWQTINLVTAEYGEARLGARYLRVRFEDLCADPRPVVAAICGFAGCPDAADGALAEVTPPASLGRWRSSPDPALVADIVRCARPALTRFGYDA